MIQYAHQVAAEQELALRVKRHTVHMSRVAGQLANELAVGGVPELYLVIVAAGGDERAVGADVE